MKSRIESFSGKLDIDSGNGHGTTLTFTIPVNGFSI
jgi:signal transduction histidine kinase